MLLVVCVCFFSVYFSIKCHYVRVFLLSFRICVQSKCFMSICMRTRENVISFIVRERETYFMPVLYLSFVIAF